MKYLRQPGYDNRYLTKDFLEIDEQRKLTEEERALPLKKMEKRKYIWVRTERLPQETQESAFILYFLSAQLRSQVVV